MSELGKEEAVEAKGWQEWSDAAAVNSLFARRDFGPGSSWYQSELISHFYKNLPSPACSSLYAVGRC